MMTNADLHKDARNWLVAQASACAEKGSPAAVPEAEPEIDVSVYTGRLRVWKINADQMICELHINGTLRVFEFAKPGLWQTITGPRGLGYDWEGRAAALAAEREHIRRVAQRIERADAGGYGE